MAAKQKKAPATVAELVVEPEVPVVKSVPDGASDIADGEPDINKLADQEAEQAAEAIVAEENAQGWAIMGLANLLHKATCRRFHNAQKQGDCAFEGGKFKAEAVAEAKKLWVDYATEIANLSGAEAARKTLALIFGKGEFEALGKGRFHTQKERDAYYAKKHGKTNELAAFLAGHEAGKTGDHVVKTGVPVQAALEPEESTQQVQADAKEIAAFLGEE